MIKKTSRHGRWQHLRRHGRNARRCCCRLCRLLLRPSSALPRQSRRRSSRLPPRSGSRARSVCRPPPAPAGPGDVPSPLAGRVTAVVVTVGQEVKEGDHLLTLEAMKMNTFVFAPKSGKVAEIKVAVGDAVEEDQILMRDPVILWPAPALNLNLSAAGSDRSSARSAMPRILDCSGWTLHDYQRRRFHQSGRRATLPPWNAVRAETQTAGRGGFSGAGFPTRAACGSRRSSRSAARNPPAGAASARRPGRLRGARRTWSLSDCACAGPTTCWSNDRKLAGLLLDSFAPSAAVVGIGINVHNHPEACDPNFADQTARLADLAAQPARPRRADRAGPAAAFAAKWKHLHASGFSCPLPRVNGLWGPPRSVELDLDGDLRAGHFYRRGSGRPPAACGAPTAP